MAIWTPQIFIILRYISSKQRFIRSGCTKVPQPVGFETFSKFKTELLNYAIMLMTQNSKWSLLELKTCANSFEDKEITARILRYINIFENLNKNTEN